LEDAPPFIRRLTVGIIGGTILLIGLALIVLPGPAFVVIPIGLAILATEFVWARRWLIKGRGWFDQARQKLSRKRKVGKAETGKPE
jgi:tellurite resistance protein TerC